MHISLPSFSNLVCQAPGMASEIVLEHDTVSGWFGDLFWRVFVVCVCSGLVCFFCLVWFCFIVGFFFPPFFLSRS